MNKARYEDLMLRFAKELHDVGVTESMKKIVEAQYTRTPNTGGTFVEEATDKFVYSHDGYKIEGVRIVKLTVKKCK
jgi:hypothetical protein